MGPPAGAGPHLELADEVGGQLLAAGGDLDRGVELLQLVAARLGAVLADVLRRQVELGAQVARLYRGGVMDRHRAHAGEDDVLGCGAGGRRGVRSTRSGAGRGPAAAPLRP